MLNHFIFIIIVYYLLVLFKVTTIVFYKHIAGSCMGRNSDSFTTNCQYSYAVSNCAKTNNICKLGWSYQKTENVRNQYFKETYTIATLFVYSY